VVSVAIVPTPLAAIRKNRVIVAKIVAIGIATPAISATKVIGGARKSIAVRTRSEVTIRSEINGHSKVATMNVIDSHPVAIVRDNKNRSDMADHLVMNIAAVNSEANRAVDLARQAALSWREGGAI
jgi:hypothetical protein